MIRFLLFLFASFAFLTPRAQTNASLRGAVSDRTSRQPLAGATVTVIEPELGRSVLSDTAGRFELATLPAGRIRLRVSMVGYQEFFTDNLLLTTAKELFVQVDMDEVRQAQQGITIRAVRNPKAPVNRDALVSGRSFSAEETQRYAASANDPSRMVLGFPGVQATRDARSDIIIRGNNPVGMQWRLEGVDIINPNHFARKGSSGGGITIFSLSMLDNSDFLTGAMPAEYGDVLSGVFDVHLRKGNDQKREHTVRAGLIGLDYATEGPIKKGRSSYLANYRYSTLGLLQAVGLNLVGERETNNFQDLSFNLAFRNRAGSVHWNFWGIGGYSKETYRAVEDTAGWKQFDDYSVYDFRTRMGALGIGNTWKLSSRSSLRSSLVFMGQRVTFVDDTLTRTGGRATVNDEDYRNSRLAWSTALQHKFGAAAALKTGLYLTNIGYDLQRARTNYANGQFESVLNGSGHTWLAQPYVQATLRPSAKFTVIPGVHLLHLTLNGRTTVDPRLALQYRFDTRQHLSLAYGLHSKVLPMGYYFYRDPASGAYPNRDLAMMRAHHYVLAWDRLLGKGWRVHAEAYYQQLFQIPVVDDPARTFWALNELDGYAQEALVSAGKGRNRGVDLTLEKFFSKGFFMIANVSLFSSTFEALNGKEYDTRFNSGRNASWTGAREWSLKRGRVFQLGGKMMYNGGFRQTPLLGSGGFTSREPVLDESRPYSLQVAPYFRADARLALRKDRPTRSWQLALDIQNVFGVSNENAFSRRYDPSVNRWVGSVQSGIVPVLSYQVDF